MKVGIRRLSEICFGLGLFIMLVVFFYDDTWYILNVFVQSVGYYLQYILQLGFHCGEKFTFILYLSSTCYLINFYLHMSKNVRHVWCIGNCIFLKPFISQQHDLVGCPSFLDNYPRPYLHEIFSKNNFIVFKFKTNNVVLSVDAFAQKGNAPDGLEEEDWMNGWTIFYWGWWIAWSPFVGMFIAKISKGIIKP